MKHILTRKEAIRKHRVMWNWIADAIENDEHPEFTHLKQYASLYIEQHEKDPIRAECYLCEYVYYQRDKGCKHCPLRWIDLQGFRCDSCISAYSIYNIAIRGFNTLNKQQIIDFVRTISNLEEKGRNEY